MFSSVESCSTTSRPTSAGPPEPGFDHPGTRRFPAHRQLVFLRQILGCQCGPEPLVHLLAQDLDYLALLGRQVIRFDFLPRVACTTALSPRSFRFRSILRTCRSLTPIPLAACFCVISFFLAFFSATSRSRSCVSSRVGPFPTPSLATSIGHFYFVQIGHYHLRRQSPIRYCGDDPDLLRSWRT
jgi:hypothetical protein